MTRIARTGLGTRLSLVLNGALWIGSKKKKTEGGSKEVGRGGGGGGVERNSRNSVCSHFYTNS